MSVDSQGLPTGLEGDILTQALLQTGLSAPGVDMDVKNPGLDMLDEDLLSCDVQTLTDNLISKLEAPLVPSVASHQAPVYTTIGSHPVQSQPYVSSTGGGVLPTVMASPLGAGTRDVASVSGVAATGSVVGGGCGNMVVPIKLENGGMSVPQASYVGEASNMSVGGGNMAVGGRPIKLENGGMSGGMSVPQASYVGEASNTSVGGGNMVVGSRPIKLENGGMSVPQASYVGEASNTSVGGGGGGGEIVELEDLLAISMDDQPSITMYSNPPSQQPPGSGIASHSTPASQGSTPYPQQYSTYREPTYPDFPELGSEDFDSIFAEDSSSTSDILDSFVFPSNPAPAPSPSSSTPYVQGHASHMLPSENQATYASRVAYAPAAPSSGMVPPTGTTPNPRMSTLSSGTPTGYGMRPTPPSHQHPHHHQQHQQQQQLSDLGAQQRLAMLRRQQIMAKKSHTPLSVSALAKPPPNPQQVRQPAIHHSTSVFML